LNPERKDEVLAAFDRDPKSDGRAIDIRISPWWFEAGLMLGFGLLVFGMYERIYWLVALGFGCVVAVFLAARSRQRRDPAAQAAQLLLAGRPDDARFVIQKALRAQPGDPTLQAMLETLGERD
jgi:hypothetical protein